jgi:hypothetical protein
MNKFKQIRLPNIIWYDIQSKTVNYTIKLYQKLSVISINT